MRAVRIVICLLVAFASFALASPAYAQAPGKDFAKKLFDEGVELEKKNDYAGALAKYHEAEQITVTAGLHFHLAFCLEMSSKLAAALDAYEDALKLARDTNKPDVEKAISARLEPLRARVPFLAVRLTTQTSDVVVQVDGQSLASVLLDGKAFRIDPGEHTVTARATGFAAFTKKVQVPASATTNVDVALEEEKENAPSPPRDDGRAVTEPPAEAAKPKSRIVPIALGAGATSFIAGGVVFFALAGGAQSDAKTDCTVKVSCNSAQKKIRTLDALALTKFIDNVGLGALTIITWTSSGSSGTATHTRVVASPTSLNIKKNF